MNNSIDEHIIKTCPACDIVLQNNIYKTKEECTDRIVYRCKNCFNILSYFIPP